MTGRALVLRGDARALPLPDASVDLIVTSPPYYALRSYSDGGQHYAGQVGSEATPAEYIAALLDCTAEWIRVLKPTGSMFVNLSDKYNSAASGQNRTGATTLDPSRGPKMYRAGRGSQFRSMRPKTLMGLPWRYALACMDELGLILRQDQIWSKVNGLPESVTDRTRRSHEYWFHFVRQPRYYSAVDEIREPASDYSRPNGNGRRPRGGESPRMMLDTCNPRGKLPGSVWEIATEPLRVPAELGVDHSAAFPLEWPRRIIAGWSPPGICVECGQGRRPVVHQTRETFYGNGRHRSGAQQVKDGAAEVGWAMDEKWRVSTTITGYACGCPQPTAPTRPAIILDPYGGTGTVALAARALGRIGITVDRSLDYCRLAQWRTSDPAQLAKAMRVEEPPTQLDGQEALFDVMEVAS